MRIQVGKADGKMAARLADLAAGRIAPAPPRDAATVMVLRSIGHDTEVLMLKRTAAMKFAPGAYVFPGGSVDPADYGVDIGWHGPSPEEFGAQFGATAEVARALVCAAVRETFEESGVLLAGHPDGGLAAPAGPEWEADRLALAAGSLPLAELLARRGLVLRADLLVPWARWITPDGEPRRFDARFFAAALPDGQQATGHAAESDHVAWLRPADAIDAAKAGTMALLPPTATTLNDFATAVAAGQGVADILGTRREIELVQPQMFLADGTPWLIIPDEVGYPL